jgi:hypothetical protein
MPVSSDLLVNAEIPVDAAALGSLVETTPEVLPEQVS